MSDLNNLTEELMKDEKFNKAYEEIQPGLDDLRKEMEKDCLEYKGFKAKIKYDEDDNIFVGNVVEISDILAFHGETVMQVEESFHNCIENYLEARK